MTALPPRWHHRSRPSCCKLRQAGDRRLPDCPTRLIGGLGQVSRGKLQVIFYLLPSFRACCAGSQWRFHRRVPLRWEHHRKAYQVAIKPSTPRTGLLPIFVLLCFTIPFNIPIVNGFNHFVEIVNHVILVPEPVVQKPSDEVNPWTKLVLPIPFCPVPLKVSNPAPISNQEQLLCMTPINRYCTLA